VGAPPRTRRGTHAERTGTAIRGNTDMENQQAMMEAPLVVPAAFVSYLRSGLLGEWGYAAELLSSLALQFGSNAPDGAYSEPLQVFDTIRILLGEISWKDNDRQGDVTIDLYVGGAYVVKGLKHEHMMLSERLDEMPQRTRKAMRDAMAARVAEFGEFVKSVEVHVDRLGGRRCKSSASLIDRPRPTIQARRPRVRQQRRGSSQ
jgi:hypothetical protein